LTKEAFLKVLGDYGNNFDRKLSNDVALQHNHTATVVILMGMSKLDQI
jgi:hypothetical protein